MLRSGYWEWVTWSPPSVPLSGFPHSRKPSAQITILFTFEQSNTHHCRYYSTSPVCWLTDSKARNKFTLWISRSENPHLALGNIYGDGGHLLVFLPYQQVLQLKSQSNILYFFSFQDGKLKGTDHDDRTAVYHKGLPLYSRISALFFTLQ